MKIDGLAAGVGQYSLFLSNKASAMRAIKNMCRPPLSNMCCVEFFRPPVQSNFSSEENTNASALQSLDSFINSEAGSFGLPTLMAIIFFCQLFPPQEPQEASKTAWGHLSQNGSFALILQPRNPQVLGPDGLDIDKSGLLTDLEKIADDLDSGSPVSCIEPLAES